jgi:hypothetical protein
MFRASATRNLRRRSLPGQQSNKGKAWPWIVTLLFLAGICVSAYYYYFYQSQLVVNVIGFPPLKYPQFQTWPTPRDFDGPGTLFVLKDGYLEYQATLKVPAKEVGEETFGSQKFTSKWSGNVLARFFSVVHSTLDTKSDLDVDVRFGDARRVRVDPDETETAMREYARRTFDGDLYVILEAISVGEIHYTISSGTALTSEAEVNSATNADAQVTAKKTDDGKWVVDAIYKKPHYVFYRPKKVTFLQGLNRPQIILGDTEESLRWQAEIR